MQLNNIKEIEAFRAAIAKCTGRVWLQSTEGDVFNLNSEFSQYIALAALLSENGEKLELFCANRDDEQHFLHFFNKFPETL